MNLHCLTETPPSWLGEALEQFERQFWYPLGLEQRFRISHGQAYLPFFQAMGRACVLVAERDGEVLGTLSRVERRIVIEGKDRLAHYLCDLKVSPSARGGRVLSCLMLEARRQIEASGSRSCYAVVMSGTGRLPVDYTGRAGIPAFEKLADILVLRFSAGSTVTEKTPQDSAKPAIRVTGGVHELRSLMTPARLQCGVASAVLDDTRRGKRLWMENGDELLSAHLSCLHFASAGDAAILLRHALVKAGKVGFPAVFTALPLSAWAVLQPCLRGIHAEPAPAAVFGHDLPAGHDWWVDTAEI